MKSQFFTIFLFLTFTMAVNAQTDVNEKGMVGFGCYEDGRLSKPVEKVSRLIYKSDFSSILKLLYSNNTAEQFLAVVIAEKLQEQRKINLTSEHNKKIAKIYKSDKLVSVCSGCTYWDKVALKTILDKKGNHQMREIAKYWLANKFNAQ